jgi:hypothetical protein
MGKAGSRSDQWPAQARRFSHPVSSDTSPGQAYHLLKTDFIQNREREQEVNHQNQRLPV